MDVAGTKRWATGISSNSGCSLVCGGGRPLLGATDGGGLEQAQQQQWGAAATKTCICGT